MSTEQKKPNQEMWKSPVFSNNLHPKKKLAFRREEERKVLPGALLTWTGFTGAPGNFLP